MGTRTITPTLENDSDVVVALANLAAQAADTIVANPTASSAVPIATPLDATLEFNAGSLRRAAFSGGDVTASAGSGILTVGAHAITVGKLAQLAGSKLLGNPTGSLADVQAVGIDSSLAFSGTNLQRAALTGDVTASAGGNATTLAAGSASVLNSGTLPAGRMPALTGDVTTTVGTVATTIANAAVTYAKIQAAVAASLLAATIGGGSFGEVTLNSTLEFSGSTIRRAALTGDVTASAGSNATTLAAGSASNLNSGTLPAGRMPALTGDVTTSAGAVATTIANDAVTNAKAANMAANTLKGNNTASTADPTDISVGTNTVVGRGSSNITTFGATVAGRSMLAWTPNDRDMGYYDAGSASWKPITVGSAGQVLTLVDDGAGSVIPQWI